MIFSRNIGDARVTNVIEYTGPTHDPAVFLPALGDRLTPARRDAISPDHFAPLVQRFVVTIQLWLVEFGGNVVVIDTGVGNAKTRPSPRMNMLNTLVPHWLAAAGAAPERVTHVINTHLHADHVGWNTHKAGERWEPFFPNARYMMPRVDFEFFKERHDDGGGDAHSMAFADSVLPVFEAGLVDLLDDARQPLLDGMEMRPRPGHTPGMFSVHLTSGDEQGIFCTDVLHTPLQVLIPDLNTAFCMSGDDAARTRRALLNEAAAASALVMPCHFGRPYCGLIVGDEKSGFSLLPEALRS